MRIKAKLKDVIMLSSDETELKDIIKWTNMLNDDPEAEIIINSEKEHSELFPKPKVTAFRRFEIVIKSINVIGKTQNKEWFDF